MAEKTNTGLVAYAKAQVGNPYWYGTYGQVATESLYNSKKKQYASTGYYTKWSDYSEQYGKRVHDCVGLIKGYLWSDSPTSVPKYSKSQDKSASGMYSVATEKGNISTFPETSGILLFKGDSVSKIHHVGIYSDDGYVYEAKGHEYGVVKTKYKASEWDYWAQCPYCVNDVEASVKEASTGETVTATVATVTEKKATESAKAYDKSLAGTYVVTGNLNMRNGAGTGKAIMTVLPKGTKVQNYGYYTTLNSVRWYSVQVTVDNVKYTGFCCGTYLKKQ